MPRARTIRGDEELEEGAVHVCYEFWMLKQAGEMLNWKVTVSSPVSISASENVQLEAFLLHYRNLRAFLCPTMHTTRPNDIVCSDFLWLPEETDVVTTVDLMRDRERLDQMLAHITYSRIKHIRDGNAEWSMVTMFGTMCAAFRDFLGSLPEKSRSWFLNGYWGVIQDGLIIEALISAGAVEKPWREPIHAAGKGLGGPDSKATKKLVRTLIDHGLVHIAQHAGNAGAGEPSFYSWERGPGSGKGLLTSMDDS
jgi:hypothetical protein